MDRAIVGRFGAVAVVLLGFLVGCGDDDEPADDGEIEEATESAGARVAAEAIRATLVAEDLGEGEHERDVAVLQESVEDVPGGPDVSGIEDADGDGRDDDGKVQVHVEDEVACLTVSESGEVDVTGGEC